MSGDHNEYQKDKSYLDFECPRCGHCCQGYELGFVDGMQHQMQLSVEKALNQDLLEVLKQFSECDLNENNCATLDVATKRIRSMARAAIAKATGEDERMSKQEPVAHITGFHNGHCIIEPTDRATVLPVGMALYRAPTEWVGLTEDEIDDIWNKYCDEMGEASINDAQDIGKAIEAKLKEKNT